MAATLHYTPSIKAPRSRRNRVDRRSLGNSAPRRGIVTLDVMMDVPIPEVRLDLIYRMRSAIASGRYPRSRHLSVAIDRMIAAVASTLD